MDSTESILFLDTPRRIECPTKVVSSKIILSLDSLHTEVVGLQLYCPSHQSLADRSEPVNVLQWVMIGFYDEVSAE